VTAASVLDLWEAGLTMTPAARAMLLLQAAGHPDVTDWMVGRRDQALLRAYCSSPGSLAAVAECPACGTALDVVPDPREMATSPVEASVVTVEVDAYRVVARPPTASDLEHLPAHASVADRYAQLLAMCVLEAEHEHTSVNPDALPEAVVAAVEAALEEADPGADLRLAMSCVDCGAEWTESLDPVRFAWSSVEASARTLATDVHALAQAYGWSEGAILELSPFRRHLYLSAVQP
jgi:hypothetical protein